MTSPGRAGALAVTRVMAEMRFGITATDPLTFAGVTYRSGSDRFARVLHRGTPRNKSIH